MCATCVQVLQLEFVCNYVSKSVDVRNIAHSHTCEMCAMPMRYAGAATGVFYYCFVTKCQNTGEPICLCLFTTVWPEPILKKVSGWWQIPPQHQSTYLGGPESVSIEIPPFRPFLWCKFPKIKISKILFALKYIKN